MKSWREMNERELVANLSSDDYYKVKLIQLFGDEETAKEIWEKVIKEQDADISERNMERIAQIIRDKKGNRDGKVA